MDRLFAVMDIDSIDNENQFTVPFKKLTKKYGREYIAYCRAAWEANGGCLTEDEFRQVNGEMPKGFFDAKVKAGVVQQ